MFVYKLYDIIRDRCDYLVGLHILCANKAGTAFGTAVADFLHLSNALQIVVKCQLRVL